MRSGSSIDLDPGWWKKGRPEGLGRAGDAFAKALEAHAKAQAAVRSRPEDDRIEAAEAALAALGPAGEAVAAEAKGLLAKTSDKALERSYKNTVSVMGRPLARAIAEASEALEELAGDDDAGDFGDPDAHAAYLRKIAPRLRRNSFRFALAVPSNDPADIRMMFHRKKGGRALMNRLRKATGARKATFGIAGMQKLAQELGHDDVQGRTLVLSVEGRRIPSLAKRVKIMMRRMKVPQFGRVRVLRDGAEEDAADDETPEAELETLDFETGPAAAASARKGGRAAPPAIASSLKRRLSGIVGRIRTAPPQRVRALKDGVEKAAKRMARRRYDMAERIVEALEAELDRLGAAPAEEVSGSKARASARRAERELLALVRRIRPLAGQPAVRGLGTRARDIRELVKAGRIDEAKAALATLETAIREAEAEGAAAPAG